MFKVLVDQNILDSSLVLCVKIEYDFDIKF